MRIIPLFLMISLFLAAFAFADEIGNMSDPTNSHGDSFITWNLDGNPGYDVSGSIGRTGLTIVDPLVGTNNAASNRFDLETTIGATGNYGSFDTIVAFIDDEPRIVALNNTGLKIYSMDGNPLATWTFPIGDNSNQIVITNMILINPNGSAYDSVVFASQFFIYQVGLVNISNITTIQRANITSWSNNGYFSNSNIACPDSFSTDAACYIQGVQSYNTLLKWTWTNNTVINTGLDLGCDDTNNLNQGRKMTYGSFDYPSSTGQAFMYLCTDKRVIGGNTFRDFVTGRITNPGTQTTPQILDSFDYSLNDYILSGNTYLARVGSGSLYLFIINYHMKRSSDVYHYNIVYKYDGVTRIGYQKTNDQLPNSNYFVGDYDNDGVKDLCYFSKFSGYTAKYLLCQHNLSYTVSLGANTFDDQYIYPDDMDIMSNSWLMGDFQAYDKNAYISSGDGSQTVVVSGNKCFAGTQGVVCDSSNGFWLTRNINKYPHYNAALATLTTSFSDPFSSGIITDNGKPYAVVPESLGYNSGKYTSSQYEYKILYDEINGVNGTVTDTLEKLSTGLVWDLRFADNAYSYECDPYNGSCYNTRQYMDLYRWIDEPVIHEVMKNIVNMSQYATFSSFESFPWFYYIFNQNGVNSDGRNSVDTGNITNITIDTNINFENDSINWTICIDATFKGNITGTPEPDHGMLLWDYSNLNMRFYDGRFRVGDISVAIPDNNEHRYCIRQNGVEGLNSTNWLTLSMDNTNIVSGNRGFGVEANNPTLYLLYGQFNTFWPWNGSVSRLQIWNRYVSDTELEIGSQFLYNGYCTDDSQCGNSQYGYCVQGCCVGAYDTSKSLTTNQCYADSDCDYLSSYAACAHARNDNFANIGICVISYQNMNCYTDQWSYASTHPTNQTSQFNPTCSAYEQNYANSRGATCTRVENGFCAPNPRQGGTQCYGSTTHETTSACLSKSQINSCQDDALCVWDDTVSPGTCYEKYTCSDYNTDSTACVSAGCSFTNYANMTTGYYYCRGGNAFVLSTADADEFYCNLDGAAIFPSFQTCTNQQSCIDGRCATQTCVPGYQLCSLNNPFGTYDANGDIYQCRPDGSGYEPVKECQHEVQDCIQYSNTYADCRAKNVWYCYSNNVVCASVYTTNKPEGCYATQQECQAGTYCRTHDCNNGTGGTGFNNGNGQLGDGSNRDMQQFWNTILGGSSFAKMIFAMIMIIGVIIMAYQATKSNIISLISGFFMFVLCTIFGLLPFYILIILVLGTAGVFILGRYMIQPGSGE